MPKRVDPRKKLTPTKVEKLVPPRSGHKDHPDGQVPGLVLRVKSSCVKTWLLWFRADIEGKRKSVVRKLGHYPEMGLEDARAAARKARESRNPLAFLGGPEDTRPTVKALSGLYIKGRLQKLKSGPKSERRLRRHVLPDWGDLIAEKLTRKQMTTLLDRIGSENGPGECLATYQLIQAMLRWSVKMGHMGDKVQTAPLAGYPPPGKVGKRDRVLSDDELREIWDASQDVEGCFGTLVRVLILTGLRRSEAACIHDDMIDLKAKTITIPGEYMKGQDAADHVVPITDMLAREIEPLIGQGYLISANGGRSPFKGFGKSKQQFDARLSFDTSWQLHDCRRSVRSGLGALNINRDIAERAIGHKVGDQLDQIYDRYTYAPQIAEAMGKWAGHVRDLVTPPPPNVESITARNTA
jgi:integrase